MMAKEYNVVVTKENVSKFLDEVLDFVYANRPQEFSLEFQASVHALPRYEIHIEGTPPFFEEVKDDNSIRT